MFHRLIAALLVVLAQKPALEPRDYIAFRLDDERVIAVLKTIDDPGPQRKEQEVSSPPAASYGFPIFEPPAEWLKSVPPTMRTGARWKVDVGGGRTLDAVAERVVGGQPQCSGAVGMLLRIAPSEPQSSPPFARATTSRVKRRRARRRLQTPTAESGFCRSRPRRRRCAARSRSRSAT
jgi:hypothetical protein